MNKQLDEEAQYYLNEQLLEECMGLGNLKEIRKLIKDGADINYFNEKSMSSPLGVAASFNNVETVKLLLKKGVSPKEHNNLALTTSSNYDCIESIELLIKHGAFVRDEYFINAYNAGNWEVAEYFLKNFPIKVADEVLKDIKKEDEEFFHEINNILQKRIFFEELNKDLSIKDLESQQRLKI